jgi:hypothetical protein
MNSIDIVTIFSSPLTFKFSLKDSRESSFEMERCMRRRCDDEVKGEGKQGRKARER